MALHEAQLTVRWGEVHALIGENGAGKSTLTRILAGLERPDAGSVRIAGSDVTAAAFGRRTALGLGVGLVQQHFTLVPRFTAEENIVLARPRGALLPGRRAMSARLAELTTRYELPVRGGIPVSQLSVGERQRLEILRALDSDTRVLLLDEPTAVLTDAEADRLLALSRALADEGRAVVVVTHRLAEVLRGCDTVTVLRNGATVIDGAPVARYTRAELAGLMVGDLPAGPPARRRAGPTTTAVPGEPVLSARSASLGRLTDCTVEVRAGEIVGVAGVDGNGQAELEDLAAGLASPRSGSVTVAGVPAAGDDPRRLVRAATAYIPSDRHRRALVAPMTVADNLELGRGGRWRPARRARERAAEEPLRTWNVRGGGPATRVGALSGGNAQKVVLARELAVAPRLVVAAQPTRGLDPEAGSAIARRLVTAADEGAAVLWFAAELDELFAVCDRIMVLVTGRPARHFDAPFDRAAIGAAMAGVTDE